VAFRRRMSVMMKAQTPPAQSPAVKILKTVSPVVRPELDRALEAVTERHRELFRRLKDK